MWKMPNRLGQHWQRHWGVFAGVATAALFLSVQWLSPHVGDSCNRLGHVEEEWRVGLPASHVICIATLDGDLVYGRLAKPSSTTDRNTHKYQ
jgi:hypothetical protein